MRPIRFVARLIDDSTVVNEPLRHIRIAAVAADDITTKFSVASKLDTD
jgi:hypothetical protein